MNNSTSLNHIGILGLGTMGYHLAQNFASHSITCSIYNRSEQKTKELARLNLPHLLPTYSLQEFITSIPTPRAIHLLIDTKATNTVIDSLISTGLLEEGDCIVDMGNSHWQEAILLKDKLQNQKLNFVSCGVSGGSKGALLGPSLMPSGDKKIVSQLLPLYSKISAKDFEGNPCVTYIGSSSSGHFVKTVHNGIEYALMQAIAEVYSFFSSSHYTNDEIVDEFEILNKYIPKTYLLEITPLILTSRHSTQNLLSLIEPIVTTNQTGKWSIEASLELNVPIPSIISALYQRYQSSFTPAFQLTPALEVLSQSNQINHDFDLTQVVILVFRLIYLQGIELITKASQSYNWNINIEEVLRIWQGGCIIRSSLLTDLVEISSKESMLDTITDVITFTQNNSIPLPVFHATLNYALSSITSLNEMALVQAQRDYFGSHGYTLKNSHTKATGGWLEN